MINLSPNPKCISRREGLLSHSGSSLHLDIINALWTTGCLSGLPAPLLFFLHPPPPTGHSWLEGAGVGHRKARLVCWDFPLSLLALWWVGGRGDWRPSASQRRRACIRPLGWRQRVLERPAGKSLRQVRASTHWAAEKSSSLNLQTHSELWIVQKHIYVSCAFLSLVSCVLWGWTARTRRCPVAAPPKVLWTSLVAWQRCTSWRKLPEIFIVSSAKLWREDHCWAAP